MLRLHIFATAVFVLAAGAARAETQFDCTPTREYVTTLTFLRSTPELGLKEEDSRRLADQISAHCTGSADRFIRTARMLLKSGMGGADAVKVGLEMAAAEERVAATFISVFKHAFLERYLDLSISGSLKLARSLSTEFEGDVDNVGRDFEALVKFCTEETRLSMPKPQCATWAADLARAGQKFGLEAAQKGGVAKPFLQAFNFLVSPQGPALAYGQAVKVAEELVAISPHSVKNFVQAYQFGMARDGLRLDTASALQFARRMAKQTRYDRQVAKSKGQG